MVSKRKKKYSSGEGARFITRRAALRRLQLSLKDFRRLCILKGIYPREPRNRKRAQKGAGGIKTLYHTKDIQFLMHEPIIWKLRDIKVYYRRIQRAKGKRDKRAVKNYLNNYPVIKIDHIIKERYPTFIDALRDLDDCLTLCFLFSTFPSIKHVPREYSSLCRRLTVEFMHALIVAKALRKVFVSIKGYYYQAEIKGQIINWIVPHHFSFQPHTKEEVDFKLMATFVEFYTVMLGFVNFRLYHSLNLQYPPLLTQGVTESEKSLIDEEVFVSERIAALNIPLSTLDNSILEDELTLDEFPSDEDPQKLEDAKVELENVKRLKTLFKGLKFFINREVPRESMVFAIRSFGGEVSWDKLLYVGATFDEDDESISHHIVDRPSMDKQFISRYYVQPQWIFDCINARTLLPTSKYLMGAILPPHLSPFIDKEKDQVYIPPEARALNEGKFGQEEEKEESEEDIEGITDEEENEMNDTEDIGEAEKLEKAYNEEIKGDSTSDESDDDSDEESKNKRKEKRKGMAVLEGQTDKDIPFEKARQEKHEFQLREKMVKKKHRRLYKSMMEGKKKRMKEIWLLRKKRRLHDEKEKNEKTMKKKQQKKETLAS